MEDGQKYVHQDHDGHENGGESGAQDVVGHEVDDDVVEDAEGVEEEVLAHGGSARDLQDAQDEVNHENDGGDGGEDGEDVPETEVPELVLDQALEENCFQHQADDRHQKDQDQHVNWKREKERADLILESNTYRSYLVCLFSFFCPYTTTRDFGTFVLTHYLSLFQAQARSKPK